MALSDKEFLAELAAIVDADPVTFTAESKLHEQPSPWDSMSLVVAVAMFDEHGATVSGEKLAACVTAGDVLRLFDQ